MRKNWKTRSYFANSLDAFIPEIWAQESLMILQNNIIAAGLVHRNFEKQIQNFGDVVNTRRPGTFTAKRKTTADNVTTQDATATNVAVPLDQHAHVSFLIADADLSKSFKNLVEEFLTPAVIEMAKYVDQVVLGQMVQFFGNMTANLGGLSTSNVRTAILNTRQGMNVNKCPENIRNLIWTPTSETIALSTDIMTTAQNLGDGGIALKEAALGRRFGFNHYMSQLMSSVPAASMGTVVTGAINNVSGYQKGATSLVVDGFTGSVAPVNGFLSIAGDLQRIVSSSLTSSNTTGIVVSPGLRQAAANDAVITIYPQGQVNNAAGYEAGWVKDIIYDTFTVDPCVGMGISFGATAGAALYTIIQVDTSNHTILLDRPLEAALADDAKISTFGTGDYNFAFHKNAIALVVRPLTLAPAEMGAKSAVVSGGDFSMRITMTYDGNAQGVRVTLDMLLGVKVLDTNLGFVMVG